MATLTFSPEQDSIDVEIFIAAPAERVFQAITDPAQVSQWWGRKGMYRITVREGVVKVGEKWRTIGVGAKGDTFEVKGEYLEVEPPRLLVHTWVSSWCGGLQTTVRWELVPERGGTLVKIHHSGFAGQPAAAQDHYQGWTRVLGWIQAYVEKSETIETRPGV